MVGAMQKYMLLFLLLTALTVTSFAQVEEAVRYRVQGDATLVEQQISVSTSEEPTGNLVFHNRSGSQLDELGARYAFIK